MLVYLYIIVAILTGNKSNYTNASYRPSYHHSCTYIPVPDVAPVIILDQVVEINDTYIYYI